MKINVYTVDFETPSWLRRAIAYVVPVALLCGAGVAYAGVKHSFQSNEVLKAADLNENFADQDARLGALEAQVKDIGAGLSTGCGPKSALAGLSGAAPVCRPANDVVAVHAEYSGTNGGSGTAVPCPTGYTLIAAAQDIDQRTQAGINGWNNGGTVSCAIENNAVVAQLGQYAGGTDQTYVSCYGICVRD